MKVTIDLNDADDVRRGLEILKAFLPAGPVPEGSILKRFLDDLWPRLGRTNRRLVKHVAGLKGLTTIEDVAAGVSRPARSVRSSLNGPLARAVKSAKRAVPGAPDLLVWRHNGSVYELGMTDDMREAISPRSIEGNFDVMPPAE